MKEHRPGEMSCRAMKVQGVGASSRSCPHGPCCPWSTAICLQGWLQKGLPPALPPRLPTWEQFLA